MGYKQRAENTCVRQMTIRRVRVKSLLSFECTVFSKDFWKHVIGIMSLRDGPVGPNFQSGKSIHVLLVRWGRSKTGATCVREFFIIVPWRSGGLLAAHPSCFPPRHSRVCRVAWSGVVNKEHFSMGVAGENGASSSPGGGEDLAVPLLLPEKMTCWLGGGFEAVSESSGRSDWSS